jgi:hypothetical protein
MILRCEKLHGLKLAERREIVEKSGLCTFCLRHGAELECYAKGGLSKPKCERLGCDGEHITGLHALLGEDDAVVNLVAGGEGEAVGDQEGECGYQFGRDHESPWAGTLEAPEAPWEADGSTGCLGNQDTGPYTDSFRDEEEMGQWEHGSLWVGTIGAVEVSGRGDNIILTTASREREQATVEEETTEDEDGQWDLEADQPSGEVSVPWNPGHKTSQRPRGNRARAPRPAGASRPTIAARQGATVDQQWEQARYDAWLRQLLSDDSSDGSDDEERYGRFAESGRWMTELYGIPQHPTTTSGRECAA